MTKKIVLILLAVLVLASVSYNVWNLYQTQREKFIQLGRDSTIQAVLQQARTGTITITTPEETIILKRVDE